MLKILQVIDSLTPGGAERMAVNMANAFAEHGIENALCVTRFSGELQVFLNKNVKFFILKKRHAADVVAFSRFAKIVKAFKPDVIHAHSSSYFWASIVRVFSGKSRLIWHNHRGINEDSRKNNSRMLNFMSRRFNGIVAVNQSLREWNVRHTAVAEDHIRFINNFPDLQLPPAIKKATDEIIVFCLANLRPEKDHVMLITAFAKLVDRHQQKNLKLWLAGNHGTPAYYRKLKDHTKALGVIDRIIFLGTVQNTAQLLARAHIGVLASYQEGLPVSLLEYGLAGLPVLVTDVGQCRDVLGNGQYGWIVPARDIYAFTETLDYMISNPEESEKRGNLLKERVTRDYGADKFIREYISFLNTLHPNLCKK